MKAPGGQGGPGDPDVNGLHGLNNHIIEKQGGRGFTGARVAPAKKFGLGRKF